MDYQHTVEALRLVLRSRSFDILLIHYDELGFKHYEAVEFDDGSPWLLGEDAEQRARQFCAESAAAEALRRGATTDVRDVFLHALGREPPQLPE